ncbi:TetR/AcrR family transcriptional regulator [Phenylobacterium sp.]|jgi:AcrR family transcriptional regulator|uniref:TetR/AcrR family transcriptional regulator n=1 Tax=Phenylobacterium sp. TaxID=1871053 RepID=UPI0025D6FAFA|nr:TetR/AcrR family transcriptional regulator [Phenylobacterium sp.]
MDLGEPRAEAIDPAWAKPAYQQRSRQQRDRLLKAGERVFAEKGFWQAHVADIAKRAACSVGSFYRRFQDKEAFFLSLQTDMAAHGEVNIARFFDDPACLTDPLLQVFIRLVRNTARTMKGIEGYYRALFELSLRGHDVWPPMRRIEILEAHRIVELLRQRGAAPADPALGDRAHLAIRMLHGQIISAMLHGPGPFAVEDPRLHDELALMLFRYLGLEASELAR